jgi:hypothetical protein
MCKNLHCPLHSRNCCDCLNSCEEENEEMTMDAGTGDDAVPCLI